MQDVYDGKVWKDFQSYNGQPFLSEPGNYALMMNMDFFQPYKRAVFSLRCIKDWVHKGCCKNMLHIWN